MKYQTYVPKLTCPNCGTQYRTWEALQRCIRLDEHDERMGKIRRSSRRPIKQAKVFLTPP